MSWCDEADVTPTDPCHNCPDDSALRKGWFQGHGRGQWDRSRQSGNCLDDAGGKDAGYSVIAGMMQETRMLLGIRCFWDEAEARMLLGTQWFLGWGRDKNVVGYPVISGMRQKARMLGIQIKMRRQCSTQNIRTWVVSPPIRPHRLFFCWIAVLCQFIPWLHTFSSLSPK